MFLLFEDRLRKAVQSHSYPIERGEEDEEAGHRNGEQKDEQLHIPMGSKQPRGCQDGKDGHEQDTQGRFQCKVHPAPGQRLKVVPGEEEPRRPSVQEVEARACSLRYRDGEH